jgi:hypothetical protein
MFFAANQTKASVIDMRMKLDAINNPAPHSMVGVIGNRPRTSIEMLNTIVDTNIPTNAHFWGKLVMNLFAISLI